MDRHRLAYLKTEQTSNVQRCIVCLSSYSKLSNVATVVIPKFMFCFVFCMLYQTYHFGKLSLYAFINQLKKFFLKTICGNNPQGEWQGLACNESLYLVYSSRSSIHYTPHRFTPCLCLSTTCFFNIDWGRVFPPMFLLAGNQVFWSHREEISQSEWPG